MTEILPIHRRDISITVGMIQITKDLSSSSYLPI